MKSLLPQGGATLKGPNCSHLVIHNGTLVPSGSAGPSLYPAQTPHQTLWKPCDSTSGRWPLRYRRNACCGRSSMISDNAALSGQSRDVLIRPSPSFVSGSILRRLCPPDETRFEKMRRT